MSVMKRFSLGPLWQAHFAAMLPPGRKSGSLGTLGILVGVPAGMGVAAGIWADGIAAFVPMIAGLGVLAGGFLSGFVLLTNLRLKVQETQSYRSRLSTLIGETAATAMYLMSWCLGLLLLIISALMFRSLMDSTPIALHVFNGLAFGFLSHIGITAMTFIRRLFAVYYELFRADFNPKLQGLPSASKDRPAS